MEACAGDRQRKWYVVMTKPGAEEKVSRQITERLRLDVYVPRIEIRIRKGRRSVPAIRPLFPGYIFIRLILPEEWRLISYTRGVSKILGGWHEPKPLDDKVVETIKEREQKPDRIIQYYNFKPADRVYIKHGPLKDLYGIFERPVDSQGRVKVLLSLVGYQASAELDASLLEKV